MLCSGLRGPGLRGGTCPNDSGHGIRSTDDSIVGANAGSGDGCSKRLGPCSVIKPLARLDNCSSPPTCGGAKRGQESQALGRSRGGFSTKIHDAVNDEGQPARLHFTEGQSHDMTCGEILLEGLEPEYVIDDKGYESDPLWNKIRSIGAKPVIPSRRTHRIRRHDRRRYKLRNVVERFISRLKHCRRVATRYDKLAATFLGFVEFASIVTSPSNIHTS